MGDVVPFPGLDARMRRTLETLRRDLGRMRDELQIGAINLASHGVWREWFDGLPTGATFDFGPDLLLESGDDIVVELVKLADRAEELLSRVEGRLRPAALVDPGRRMTEREAAAPPPPGVTFEFYSGWRTTTIDCSWCGWTAPAEEAQSDMDDYCLHLRCRGCYMFLGVVTWPTREQIEAAAAAGDEAAIEQLRSLEKRG